MVVTLSADARIPGALPNILKDYTKAAIRTQPTDVLIWSAAYFKAICEGTEPPVKDRLEYPVPEFSNGISPGILRVLNRQMSKMHEVSWATLKENANAMGVPEKMTREAFKQAGGVKKGDHVHWPQVLTQLAASSSNSIAQALQLIMTTSTNDTIQQLVPLDIVLDHYERLFLANHDHELTVVYQDAVEYLTDIASYQDGSLAPSDLTRASCPPLQ